jgi:hypothetical protein
MMSRVLYERGRPPRWRSVSGITPRHTDGFIHCRHRWLARTRIFREESLMDLGTGLALLGSATLVEKLLGPTFDYVGSWHQLLIASSSVR